jgi:hypothetical protein
LLLQSVITLVCACVVIFDARFGIEYEKVFGCWAGFCDDEGHPFYGCVICFSEVPVQMNPVLFAATAKVDPHYAKARGTSEATRVAALADRYIGILDGYDIDLTFDAKNPTDFDVSDTVKVEGYSKLPGSDQVNQRHVVFRKMATNPFLFPFNVLAVPITAVIGLFNRDFRGLSRDAAKALKTYTTEDLEKFVVRAFNQIKTEMDTARSGKPNT